jgi:hypothetical protein
MTHRTERFGAEIKSAPLNFKEIADTALFSARSLLPHWLPGGRWEGEEYVAKNPTRADEHPGSFKINARSGVWSDFATGDAGRDLLDLKAFLDGSSLTEAALHLAQEASTSHHGARTVFGSWMITQSLIWTELAAETKRQRTSKPMVA